MNLVIDNPDNLNLDAFCQILITLMQNYIRTTLDTKQLIRFDAYLNNEDIIDYADRSNRLVSSKDILIGSTYNLVVIKDKDKYIIQLDNNINIPNTYAKFIDIVKLINYGNLALPAYPIYDNMMDYFAENLLEYYRIYLEEA